MTSCKMCKYLGAEPPAGAETPMCCSKSLQQRWLALLRPHAKNDGPNLRELCAERKDYIQLKFLCQRLDIFIGCGGLSGYCANMCHATTLDSRTHTRRPSDRRWGKFSVCSRDEPTAFTIRSGASHICAALGPFVAVRPRARRRACRAASGCNALPNARGSAGIAPSELHGDG